MIRQTKEVKIENIFNKISKEFGKVSMNAVAAEIRHNHTNYDEFSMFLSTDKAEEIILETYRTVVNINSATKDAMIQWAKKKIESLA